SVFVALSDALLESLFDTESVCVVVSDCVGVALGDSLFEVLRESDGEVELVQDGLFEDDSLSLKVGVCDCVRDPDIETDGLTLSVHCRHRCCAQSVGHAAAGFVANCRYGPRLELCKAVGKTLRPTSADVVALVTCETTSHVGGGNSVLNPAGAWQFSVTRRSAEATVPFGGVARHDFSGPVAVVATVERRTAKL
ncbi:MAG: hypothetical protein Q8J97_02320, partial [Flavobacteriaceae bacterium]|nr:hypothetical protein [Flavobacteriaceae bacterium]